MGAYPWAVLTHPPLGGRQWNDGRTAMTLAAACVAAFGAVVVAVTDMPSQVFGIGLATIAFSVLVYSCNELRRSVTRTQHENARLREAMFKMIESKALRSDPGAAEAIRELITTDVTDDGDGDE